MKVGKNTMDGSTQKKLNNKLKHYQNERKKFKNWRQYTTVQY